MKSNYPLFLIFFLTVSLNFSCKKEATIIETSYSPITMGSSWNYEGYLIEPTFSQMTGRTIEKFGKKYYEKVVNSSLESFTYFGTQEGSDYYTIVADPSNSKAENVVLYLKANAKIGESWVCQIKYGSDMLGEQWKYEIIEKGITKVVEGKSYNDVIHTRRISDGLTLDSYYALGIGLIETDYSSGAKSTLKSCSIRQI